MLVESATLSAFLCLLFIIPFGINNAMQSVILVFLAQIQVISLFVVFTITLYTVPIII